MARATVDWLVSTNFFPPTNLPGPVPQPERAMLNVTLNRNDSIETVLPALQLAMHTGDVCRVHNINHLGHIHTAALTLLAMSESLMDSATGQVFHPQPGFRLLGIDENGVTRTLVM
jgi:hypothetical protein